MPTMANEKAAPAFMNLPLEVRHTIFEYVAARDFKSKKLLRYWFEKKEIKKLVEQAATNNPNGPTPRVVYDDYDDYDDDYDESAVADGDGEDDDEEENENVEEDSENEDESEGEDESEDEGAEQDEDSDEDEDGAGIEGEDDDEDEESEEAVDGAQNAQPATAQVTAQVNPDNQPADDMGEDAGQAHVDGDEHDGEAEGALANTGEEGEDEDEDDEDLANGEVSTGTAVAAIQPPPVFRPQPKWRHIPNFMRLTQCPPPVQLLLTSQQLNNEAKNWFYDVAILRIDATGSFAHTSFFEEAFGQITDAAFSPMENIRKVDVTFVWDSTWIRADKTDCVEAIFPALLRQRSSFVYQILLQAPDLREVVIHWHDSVRDDESTNLMLDNLAPFHTLPATVKIIEHYIQADATPKKRSVAGKRRIEFQNILDMGLDRLF